VTNPYTLHRIEVNVCTLCLRGRGGECHVPGCAFWMDKAPLHALLDLLREWWEATPREWWEATP
jgi:hypothetical protein